MDYKAELIRLKEYLQTEIQFISDEDDVRDRYARQANKNTLEKVIQILKRGEGKEPTSELQTKALALNNVVPSTLFESKLLKEIQKYSGKYQISFQFWGEGNNNVFIMKDDVDLFDTGSLETAEDIIIAALHYLYKINKVPNTKRIC